MIRVFTASSWSGILDWALVFALCQQNILTKALLSDRRNWERRYPFGNVYLYKFKCGINLFSGWMETSLLRSNSSETFSLLSKDFHSSPSSSPSPFQTCSNSRWTALLLTNDMVVVSNAGSWLWRQGAAGHASALQQHLFPLLQLGTDREGVGGWCKWDV